MTREISLPAGSRAVTVRMFSPSRRASGKEKEPSGATATRIPLAERVAPGSVVPVTRTVGRDVADPSRGPVRIRVGGEGSWVRVTATTGDGFPAMSQARTSTRFGPTARAAERVQAVVPAATTHVPSLTRTSTRETCRLSSAVPVTEVGLEPMGGASKGDEIVTEGGG